MQCIPISVVQFVTTEVVSLRGIGADTACTILKNEKYTSAVRSTKKRFFDQNSALQAACDTSIACVTGCVYTLVNVTITSDSDGDQLKAKNIHRRSRRQTPRNHPMHYLHVFHHTTVLWPRGVGRNKPEDCSPTAWGRNVDDDQGRPYR